LRLRLRLPVSWRPPGVTVDSDRRWPQAASLRLSADKQRGGLSDGLSVPASVTIVFKFRREERLS
jgi:hypothetical protein